MRTAAVVVAVVAAAVPAAAGPGDAPVAAPASISIELQPVQLVFAAADTTDDLLSAATGAAQTRAGAAGKCFARTPGEASGVALITVDKHGKTSKLLVGGTGDGKLDRCLEKALKPTAWPATSRGGAIVLTITAGRTPQVGTSEAGADELLAPGHLTRKSDDSGDLGRVSASVNVDLGTAVTTAKASYRDSVMDTLRGQLYALRTCYSKALASDRDLRGATALKITIGGDGAVVAVSQTSSVSPDLDVCMTKAIKRLSFPAPPNGNAVDLEVPLTLSR